MVGWRPPGGENYQRRRLKMRLKEKVAIITGASSGIGYGIALKFAREGSHVCLVGNNHYNKAKELADRIKKGGGKAIAVKASLTNMADLDRIVESTLNEFQKIDILVNNAGIFFIRMLDQLTEKEFDETFDINVKGPYFLTQKVVPHMQKTGKGKIIFVGSIFGPIGAPAASSYGASKMAVHGPTMCLSQELAPIITVNAVAPGNVDTPMNYPLYDNFGGREAFRAQYPLGRLGLESDVAAAVTFLASDEADWITGVVLPVDGGYLAK